MARPLRRKKIEKQALERTLLEFLGAAERPLTAYTLQSLAARAGQRLYPTQIYRALARLVEAGQVRRIEIANAYMLRADGTDAIALCDACGRAFAYRLGAPVEDIVRSIAAQGFAVRALAIEAVGRCTECGR